MDIRIPLGRGVRIGALAVASILLAAACSSTAAGGGASAAAGAAAPAAPAVAAGGGAYSGGGAAYGGGGAAYGGGGPAYGGGGDATPAAASQAPAESAAAGGNYVVATATDAKAGTFLTGEDGKTLYTYSKDSAGTSVCSGDCATNWPPFTLDTGETVKAGTGVAGTLATSKRADGGMQVTYNGQPLYYFAADQKAGDVNGQGIGGVWYVAAP